MSTIAKQRDLEAHLDTVKSRVESQGLSALALEGLARTKPMGFIGSDICVGIRVTSPRGVSAPG